MATPQRDIPVLDSAPDWFRRAMAVPFEDERVEVAGVVIHYLAWGKRGRRGLVFVHGGGAHAHWWTHLAATFAEDLRVVALDLSGHGDSGHRDAYDIEQWTEEVMAVAHHGGIAGRPVVIGHSMGGFVTIATAALHAEDLAGVIVCDSPVTEPDPEVERYRLKEAFGNPRTYTSVDVALARFRTVPPQEHYCDFVMDHVARRSLRAVDDGFRWKFDRHVFEQFGGGMRGIAQPYLGAGAVPVRPPAVRARPGHRGHRRRHVRGARPRRPGDRDPGSWPPRHARPAAGAAHRAADLAGRLGPL